MKASPSQQTIANLEATDARAPDDIEKRITEIMRKHPRLRWGAAVEEVLAAVTRRASGR